MSQCTVSLHYLVWLKQAPATPVKRRSRDLYTTEPMCLGSEVEKGKVISTAVVIDRVRLQTAHGGVP